MVKRFRKHGDMSLCCVGPEITRTLGPYLQVQDNYISAKPAFLLKYKPPQSLHSLHLVGSEFTLNLRVHRAKPEDPHPILPSPKLSMATLFPFFFFFLNLRLYSSMHTGVVLKPPEFLQCQRKNFFPLQGSCILPISPVVGVRYRLKSFMWPAAKSVCFPFWRTSKTLSPHLHSESHTLSPM